MSLFDAILAGKLTGGGGGGSLPKSIPYEYMPEGYPRQEEEIVEISFDGSLEGRETVDLSDKFGPEAYSVKVSDSVPKKEDLVGGSLELSQPSDYMPSGTISADMLLDAGDGNYGVGSEFVLVVANPEGTVLNVPFSSAGVWFVYSPGVSYYKSLRYSAKTVTPIAEKFMPKPLVVQATMREGGTHEAREYTLSHSANEIIAAVEKGKTVFVLAQYISAGSNTMWGVYTFASASNGNPAFIRVESEFDGSGYTIAFDLLEVSTADMEAFAELYMMPRASGN